MAELYLDNTDRALWENCVTLEENTAEESINYRENEQFGTRKPSIVKANNGQICENNSNSIINSANQTIQKPNMDLGHNEPKSTEELAAYIQSTLSNLQTKFTNISDGILSKVDNMSSRIDSLERSIAELMTASGVDISENALTPRNWGWESYGVQNWTEFFLYGTKNW